MNFFVLKLQFISNSCCQFLSTISIIWTISKNFSEKESLSTEFFLFFFKCFFLIFWKKFSYPACLEASLVRDWIAYSMEFGSTARIIARRTVSTAAVAIQKHILLFCSLWFGSIGELVRSEIQKFGSIFFIQKHIKKKQHLFKSSVSKLIIF